MALDQASQEFLQQLADLGAPAFHAMEPPAARAFFAGLRDIIGEGPEVYQSKTINISAAQTKIPLRILLPSEKPEGLIIYLHGGGWVVGELDDYDTLGRLIATESNCAVVLVDYRLAPEHRFPAAVNDSWAATQWVASNQYKITGTTEKLPLIIAGDSAGGNLAAVIAQKARDAKSPELLMQVLIYPVTQPDLDTPAYIAPSNQGLLTREDMGWFWNNYVPNPAHRENPEVSPLLSKNLSDLPPALIITAEHDVLSEEGAEYAQRLIKAGVDVCFRKYSGQIHGFFSILRAFPESKSARTFLIGVIRQRITQFKKLTPSPQRQ